MVMLGIDGTSQSAMFAVMLFLFPVGSIALHQLVKVYFVAVEVRAVHAGT